MSFTIQVPGSDGLHMRLLEPHHAKQLWPLIDKYRAHISRFLPWPNDLHSLADCRKGLEKLHSAFGNLNMLNVSIMLGDEIIGGSGWTDWRQGPDFANTLERGSADIGYWILPTHEGQGHVSRCVVALTHMAFSEYGLFRLTIRAETANERSRAVPLRCGYVEEGVMRHSCRYEGRMIDHHLFAAYADNWQMPGEMR